MNACHPVPKDNKPLARNPPSRKTRPKPRKKATRQTETGAQDVKDDYKPGEIILRTPSRAEIIRSLVSRPAGATMAELAHATGWAKHSLRAHISRLSDVESVKVEDVRIYRVAPEEEAI